MRDFDSASCSVRPSTERRATRRHILRRRRCSHGTHDRRRRDLLDTFYRHSHAQMGLDGFPTVDTADGKVFLPAWMIASKCAEAWDEFLERHGMLTLRIRE